MQRRLLFLLAVSVLLLVVVRAWVQSITLDEALSFRAFARSFAGTQVFHSNNLILNTIGMWLATQWFGISHLTIRASALLGAAIYIAVSYLLCRRISSNPILQVALFLCLTCNPFILDFLVAARGYSLANAFLLAAVATPILAGDALKWRTLRRACVFASFALGCSIAANFSFAFVATMAWIALAIWAIRRRGGQSFTRILTVCTVPAALVLLATCGYAIAHWKVGQWQNDLWWGAHSLAEMGASFIDASLYQPNQELLGPHFANLAAIIPWLLPSLGVLCLASLLIATPRPPAVLRIAAVLVSSLSLSWLAFRLIHLPLPLGRTGIYVVTLCTLIAGLIAAAPASSRASLWLSRAITANLLCLACFFLLCLRMSYFREYIWDADVAEVYSVLAELNRRHGAVEIEASGIYVEPLNVYREMSGKETFPDFQVHTPEHGPGHAVYVLHKDFFRDFIHQQRLAVIYTGRRSDVMIALQSDGGGVEMKP